MKYIVMIIIAFFLAIGTYAVFSGVETDIATEEANTTALNTVTSVNKKPSKIEQKVKKEAVKKKKKVAPRITEKSKRLFLKNTIAAIIKVKARLDAQYEKVYALSKKEQLTQEEQALIDKLKKSYKVKGIPCILKRLRTHPVSIVIAQAALETGWGSSRFYRDANNIFGIWSYNKNEPRMAAGIKRAGVKTIYVKKYKSLEASIEGYYRMMARGRSYKQFRIARLHTDNPFKIIPFLDHYSELRHEYVKRLYYVIKSNKFYELDEPSYQPPRWSDIKPADPKYLITTKEKSAAQIADKCKKDNNNSTLEDQKVLEVNSSSVLDVRDLPQETNSTDINKSITIEDNTSVVPHDTHETNTSKAL